MNGDIIPLIVSPIWPVSVKFIIDHFVNKYGKIMFETKNSTDGWNGISYGEKQPMDVYLWMAEGIDNNGNVIQKNGNVLLIR